MLEKMIFYAKLYVDSDKNMEDYKNCIRVFEKFCNIYRQREVTSEIFNFYFTNWLPKIYGQTEIWHVENMLPAVMDFCHDYDCEGDTFTEDILYDLPCCIELDLKRILKLKSEILKFTDSPYISFLPYVFNFSSKENFSKKVVDTIKGSFKMAEVFTNNSIVINKLSGYNSYVRVHVNNDIIKLLRKGDLLKLELVKYEGMKCWDIKNVYGCFTSYATDSKGIILKENI